jgi:hypothetical protein
MRIVSIITVTLLTAGCTGSGANQVTSFETPGSLQSTSPVGCVDVVEITSKSTPADIYPGVRKCIDAKEFDKAVNLFAIAGLYGRFDKLRVNDASAHQAIPALQMEHLGSINQSSTDAFQSLLQSQLEPGSATLKDLCSKVKVMGPPSYRPEYMLQHGMSAFTGSGGGMAEDFDSAAGWEESLEDYLHCPRPS